jgi:Ca2+-transporting ATPase
LQVTESAVKNDQYGGRAHTGLSEREAKRKLEEHGPNTLKGKKKVSVFKILLDQFSDFMVLILLASTAVSAFMGEMTEAITIIAIVILNAILGFVQEYRTEKTLEALKGLAAPTAKVLRDGKLYSIPAENIVPGDLIMLEAGDRVPADGVLLDAKSLYADESLLTGESVPVEKSAGTGDNKSLDLSHKASSIYMGTIITRGRAMALVYATGMNTEMGKIADMIENIEDEETPLQRKLEHLGKFIAYGCLIICAVVAATGVLRGEELFTMLLAGISLAVAAVPEGLPAIVTISLALGVQRMLKRNALIRKLPAVETLGCAGVICSDKTGTLTENKMTVKRVYAGESLVEVEGNGFNPEGSLYIEGKKLHALNNAPVRLALEIGALCNNSRLVRMKNSRNGILGKVKTAFSSADRWRIEGDPTEGALLVAASKAGLTEEVLSKDYFRIDELPFDSERKCMSVVCDSSRGETFVFTKGAPDIVIRKCTRIYTSRGIVDLTPSLKLGILGINDTMAGDALRVLGTAYKRLDTRSFKHDEAEKDLVFVGLTGMIDPPRKEAIEAVQKCRLAGIKPVMITGDHKLTACAIARELSIFSKGDRVVTGNELEEMDERKLEKIADNISVYARVTPKHKLMIVRTLKKLGHVVAMTGDVVNDAPAVKEADIGIAMGITGTDVTKEASSMILLDDNFATIVAAIEEGRVIYNNIRKFIRYMLACNFGEVLTMFLGMLIGLPLPLLPIQILWVNLVTDGLPAIALGLDPPERDIMMRPPRGSKDNIFSHGLLNLILYRGILIGLCTLAVFTSVLYFMKNLDIARTAAFVILMIMQLIHVFECKSEKKSLFEIPILNNMALVLAVACSLAMVFGVVYIPALQGVFKTVPLTVNEWILITGFSFLGPAVSGLFNIKWLHVKRSRR